MYLLAEIRGDLNREWRQCQGSQAIGGLATEAAGPALVFQPGIKPRDIDKNFRDIGGLYGVIVD